VTISEALRLRVSAKAKYRCGYCQLSALYIYAPMEIDHILPKSAGGTDEEANLWLSCCRCNLYKGEQTHALDIESGQVVAIYNPLNQHWADHFRWDSKSILIVGKTSQGRATITALRLNLAESVEFRRVLVKYGLHPPKN
jgi:hypothetical protein